MLRARFRLDRLLSSGSTGEVHLAEDRWSPGHEVAVKVLAAPRAEHVDAFRSEFAVARRLRHPGLARVLHLGRWDHSRLCLVSEVVEGTPIDVWWRQRGDADAHAALAVLAHAATTLAYLHASGVVHGDLKPEHILVPDAGGTCRLIDLGLAASAGSGATRVGGTPAYMAPELLAGAPRTAASDLFAFGATAVRVLTGRALAFEQLATFDAEGWDGHVEELIAAARLPLPVAAPLRESLAHAAAARTTAEAMVESLCRAVGLQQPSRPLAEVFVGRDTELAVLRRNAREVVRDPRGGPRLLWVGGAAGSGKSRLVDELATSVELDGGLVLGGPRVDDRDPVDRVVTQLAGLGVSGGAGRSVDATCLWLLEALRPTQASAPVMIWLDQLTGGDLLARRFVAATAGEIDARRLERHGPRAAWILCVTADAGLDTLAPDCAGRAGDPIAEVALAPFDGAMTGALLAGALAPEAPQEDFVRRTFALSGGRPDLILEVARALREGDSPSSDAVEDLLDRRLAVCSTAERELLAALACFDVPAPEPWVAAAGIVTDDVVRTLGARGMLVVSGGAAARMWYLASALLRQHLRRRDGVARTRERHRAVVALIRAQRDPDAEALGTHLLLAGELVAGATTLLARAQTLRAEDPRDALRIVRWVAEHATGDLARCAAARVADLELEVGEPAAAAAHYEKLAPRPDEAQLRLSWARALCDLGDYGEALRIAGSLRDVEAPIAGEVAALRARLLLYLGRYDAAADLARGALTNPALSALAATRAMFINVTGLVMLYQGDAAGAERVLRDALDCAAGDARLRASIQSSIGMARQKRGDLVGAAQLYDESLRAVRALGDRSREIARLLNLATVYQETDDWAQALQTYRSALALAARLRQGRDVVRVGYNLTNLLVGVGALDEALQIGTEARSHARRLAMPVEEAFLWLLEAEIKNLRLDAPGAAGALAAADAVDAHVAESNAILLHDRALQTAALQLLRSDYVAARAALAVLPEPTRQTSADVLLVAADIELADPAGEHEHTAQLLGHCEALATQTRQRWLWHLFSARLAAAREDEVACGFHGQRARQALDRVIAQVPVRYRRAFVGVRARAQRIQQTRGLATQGEPAAPAPAADWHRRILQINRRLGRQLDLQPLLEVILDEAIDLAEAERGFVLMAEGDELVVQAARHIDMESLRKPQTKLSHSIAQKVIATGEQIVTIDAMADDRFREQASIHDLKLRSVACVPLEVADQIAGALYLDNRFRPNAFGDEIRDILAAFADQAAIAIRHARLREALLDRQRQLEASQGDLARLNEGLRREVEDAASRLSVATERLRSERDEQRLRYRFANIVARSHQMTDVLALVERLASVDVAAFIHGESGTGKELVARAIHNAGNRGDGPFVAINCGAIPDNLLESELFGAKRGAFTGAHVDRPGLFAVADGGTIFLDEVGDMSPHMQVRLLRVLETKSFRPLGGTAQRTTDVRVLSASNKDLQQLVAAGDFRLDLFYRLNGATVRLAPLRERREDIPELVQFLLERAAKDLGLAAIPQLTADAVHALSAYDWPGNIRELDNELRRALIFADGEIDARHLSEGVARHARATVPLPRGRGAFRRAVAQYERRLLLAALEQSDGDPAAALASLGLSRSVFYARCKRYGIKPKRKGQDPNNDS